MTPVDRKSLLVLQPKRCWEDRERLLNAFQSIGQAALASLDGDEVLGSLAEQRTW